MATRGNKALPYDTTRLASGQHTITASISRSDGAISVIRAGMSVG